MDKVLYTNGCSWTAGNGLNEDPVNVNRESFLKIAPKYAWPEKLREKLKYSRVVNDAIGAGSNKRIFRRTVELLLNYPKNKLENLTIVISWSTIERNEIFLDSARRPGWYRFNARQQFSTNHKREEIGDIINDIDQYQMLYLKHVYNYRINLTEYFHQNFLLSNLCENLGVKYLFTNALFLNYSRETTDGDINFFEETLEKIKKPAIIINPAFNMLMIEKICQ